MTAGFGLERLGLWSLRHTRVMAVLAVILTLLSGWAASKLEFQSNIREIFKSNAADYAVLEDMIAHFPATEHDVIAVVEGDLFRPDTLEDLRTLHLELVLLDDVDAVTSVFSAYRPPNENGDLAALIPADLSPLDEAGFDHLRRDLLAHPLVTDKLLAKDGRLALFVVSLAPGVTALEAVRAKVDEIRGLGTETLTGTGATVRYTGMPQIRLTIVDALQRDQKIFRIVGFFIGIFLTWLFFRRLSYVIVVAVPVLTAIVWQLGAMWLLGQSVNIITAVVPTLVMVLSFSDGLHMMFAAARNRENGMSVRDAVEASVIDVGPAAALTSLTTTLALLSLAVVPHPYIAGFGLAGAIGATIAFFGVIFLFPLLAVAVLNRVDGTTAAFEHGWIGHLSVRLSRQAAAISIGHPGTVTVVAAVLTAICAGLYLANPTYYDYRSNLPVKSDALIGVSRIDATLAGSGTMAVYLTMPEGQDALAPESLSLIAEAQKVLAADPMIGTTWSLQDVVDWYESGQRPTGSAAAFLAENREHLARRVIGADGRSALVTGYFPNSDAAALLPVIERLENGLDTLRAAHPDATIRLTGFDLVAARASTAMIRQLNYSLIGAVVVIILLIGVALRSRAATLLSILPNVLPIAFGGAFLYLSDFGLQFTSVIAFTISFGIAVDSTIHMFNRHRLMRAETSDPIMALSRTVTTLGPVLIISTVVLVLGLGTTVTSLLPNVRLYGYVSVLVLMAAFFANILLLPALLTLHARWRMRREQSR
ncbi:MAG: hypothetical protein C0606_10255 [Hyphomicrobiales bacterium]|nr:MAG: hypothetical protein C0606_10255 [Hyphomicrobiales bacterium]